MEKYKKAVYIGVGVLVFCLLIFISLKYLLGIILPFALSFVIVSLLRPTIEKISKRSKIPKTAVCVFVICFALIVLVLTLTLTLTLVANQLGNITGSLIENLSNENNFVTVIFDFIDRLKEKFSINNSGGVNEEELYNLVLSMLTDGIKGLSNKLTSWLARSLARLPQLIITLIVALISLFYFAKDYDKIGEYVRKNMPSALGEKMPVLKHGIMSTVVKYVKSYMILIFLTFAELFSAFLILGIKNAFVLAIIISLLDALPVIGTGGVLLPWAIIMLIDKNTKIGIGLIVVAVIVYVVRQWAEPRILSTQMNVHPLITLFAMYAGLKIAGLGGMIFAPLIAFVIKTSYTNLKKQKNVEKLE